MTDFIILVFALLLVLLPCLIAMVLRVGDDAEEPTERARIAVAFERGISSAAATSR
jgi:hypothetical protein